MSSSNVSTRKPETWFPVVSAPPVPPFVEAATSLFGGLLELGFTAMIRNMQRDLSALESLSQVRDLKSLFEQQRRYAEEFWRDQGETLNATGRLLRKSFDQTAAPEIASESSAGKRVDQPETPVLTATNTQATDIESARRARKDSLEISTIFEIYLDKAAEYRFRLKASDGTVLLRSEGYRSRSSAVKGIASVKKNASNDARYTKQLSATGKPMFNLKAGNHQVIGTSAAFASAGQMESVIRTIMKTAASSEVDDQTQAA